MCVDFVIWGDEMWERGMRRGKSGGRGKGTRGRT